MTGAAARTRAGSARRVALAGALGVGLALLVGCGSATKGLIPRGQAGPLLSDFEAVQRAAEKGDGDCSATERAIARTERHYAALGSSVNAALRAQLRKGIENLGARARELCAQPPAQTTTTGTTTIEKTTPAPKTTPTPTTPPTTTPEERETEPEEPSREVAPGEEAPSPGGAEAEEFPGGATTEGTG